MFFLRIQLFCINKFERVTDTMTETMIQNYAVLEQWIFNLYEHYINRSWVITSLHEES